MKFTSEKCEAMVIVFDSPLRSVDPSDIFRACRNDISCCANSVEDVASFQCWCLMHRIFHNNNSNIYWDTCLIYLLTNACQKPCTASGSQIVLVCLILWILLFDNEIWRVYNFSKSLFEQLLQEQKQVPRLANDNKWFCWLAKIDIFHAFVQSTTVTRRN